MRYHFVNLLLLLGLLLGVVPVPAQQDDTEQQHINRIEDATVTRDGRWILTASGLDNMGGDSTVGVWDAATGKLARRLQGHTGGVFNVAATPQSDRVVSCGYDETVRVWEIETGRCLLTIPNVPTKALTLVPTGRFIVADDGSGGLKFLTVANGQVANTLKGPKMQGGILWTLRISPDCNYAMAYYHSTGPIRVWDIAQQKWLRDIPLPPDSGYVWNMEVTQDGSKLIAITQSGVHIWDMCSGANLHHLLKDDLPINGALTPDSRQLLVAANNEISLIDLATGNKLRTCATYSYHVWGFTPDCRNAVEVLKDSVRLIPLDMGN